MYGGQPPLSTPKSDYENDGKIWLTAPHTASFTTLGSASVHILLITGTFTLIKKSHLSMQCKLQSRSTSQRTWCISVFLIRTVFILVTIMLQSYTVAFAFISVKQRYQLKLSKTAPAPVNYYYYYRTKVQMKCIQQNKNKNILVHMQTVLYTVLVAT